MSEELEILKRKRSKLRERTSSIVQRTEEFLKNSNFDLDELEDLLNQLSVKEGQLKELDGNIEGYLEDLDEIESEFDEAQSFEENMIKWMGRANRRLQSEKEQSSSASGLEQPDTEQIPRAENNICTVKLPTLSLEKFYGDPVMWHSFWNQFDAAINQNRTLANVDKFNYLRSYLGGSAASAISGLMLTNEGYDVAIDLLKERFGRKDLIIHAHMNKLLNLQPVKRASDLKGLRQLYDVCEIQFRSLSALGVHKEMYGSMLCPVLLKLVPEELALEFSKKGAIDGNWDVMELVRFLKAEVEGRERAALFLKPETNPVNQTQSKPNLKNYGDQSQSKHYEYKRKDGNMPTTAVLNTAVEKKCIYCNKNNVHKWEDCTELTVSDRKELLRKQGRCFICLGLKHRARHCKYKYKTCRKCGQRHNVSICDGNLVEMEEPQTTVMSSVIPNIAKPEACNQVLLQTLRVNAKGNGETVTVRCLLDGGSQRTFIREDLSRRLKLVKTGEEFLSICTFSSEKSDQRQFNRVRVLLKNLFDTESEVILEALEIPDICSAAVNVPRVEIAESIAERGVKLTDVENQTTNDDSNISFLIGADFYWDIVSGSIERLSDKLVAVHTKLGWCIQGPMAASAFTSFSNSVFVMKSVVTDHDTEISRELKSFWEIVIGDFR